MIIGGIEVVTSQPKPKVEKQDNTLRALERAARAEIKRLQKDAMESFYRSEQWKNIREAVSERDNGQCYFCNRIGTRAHNIVPPSQGGDPIDLDNLVWCCAECSRVLAWDKSPASLDQKREVISRYLEQQRSETEDTYL